METSGDVGRSFRRHADALHFRGQRGSRWRRGFAPDLRGIEIGAELEGDGEPHGAVARALRRHVEHVLDAIDLLLDRRRDGFRTVLRVGARIVGRDLDRRRRDLGKLRDRQRPNAIPPTSVMTILSTPAKIGRSMKKWEKFIIRRTEVGIRNF